MYGIILGVEFIVKKINDNGSSFCQVDRSRQFGQFRDAITFGNQKCSGARPAFKNKESGKSRKYRVIKLE